MASSLAPDGAEGLDRIRLQLKPRLLFPRSANCTLLGLGVRVTPDQGAMLAVTLVLLIGVQTLVTRT